MLAATLAVIAWAAGPARAQVVSGGDRVSNAPASGSDVKPSLSFGTAGGTPDTTSPWRYYPLEVGNVWEYWSGQATYRREVTRDTVINNRRYAFIERTVSQSGGPPVPDPMFPFDIVRLDTASAQVLEPVEGSERVATTGPPCPLDIDIGIVLDCQGAPFTVEGGDGLIVFGAPDGTVPDTLRPMMKTFQFETFLYIVAADIGEVFTVSEVQAPRTIAYARVGGVEYGVSRFPTGGEDAPRRPAVPALRTWPNPSGGRVTVGFTVEHPEAVWLTVRDLSGREVYQADLGVLGPGTHETPVDLDGLAHGSYIVEVLGRVPLGVAIVALGGVVR